MLLLHQTGTVRVGEVVRYTLTYIPSLDRILPPPTHLHVKIKNTSAIALRAAYLHGPYTLYVSCYPSTFDPNQKFETGEEEGDPDYEPQLKAGGHWTSKLKVPEHIRHGAGLGEHKEHQERKSFTWIIEVASQVLFSSSASVHFELLVGRDENSVNLGFTGVVSSYGAPGRLEDHQQGRTKSGVQPKGVFTKAVKLRIDDTASLWNTPAFPHDEETTGEKTEEDQKGDEERIGNEQRPRKKRKKIHLVLITHGLHSNLGADMLYLKESIDVTAKQAREDARRRKQELREQMIKDGNHEEESAEREDDDDDEEQVIVRGFNGNAVRTEKGIQYLGKRFAKYVLSLTYPDQPYLPVKSTITQSISRTFTGIPKPTMQDGRRPSHKSSSVAKDEKHTHQDLPYKITSISFIGHSLGGLIQTYAVAYIQKHSPEFFDKIEPVNFVALASPFLGLSNENPMYVKFALDFGLVGRTGQDLGLTWRAPTIARNGWGAMVSGFSSDNKPARQPNPSTKPLLKILPTGPAHIALKRFRNRSVYSNVVNDGIVPLRTSCLLFLDWRGLGRVEKARRENGLVGTMVNWGLNEITGTNASTPRRRLFEDLFSDSGDEAKQARRSSPDPRAAVPQAEAGFGLDQDAFDARTKRRPEQTQMKRTRSGSLDHNDGSGIWSTFTNIFRPHAGTQKTATPKQQRIYRRGQILDAESETDNSEDPDVKSNSSLADRRKLLVRGASLYNDSPGHENLDAPPRTTVFESAGDLLNPPLPPKEFLLDPRARPRTIFHDRVYHPEDIPPPPLKRQKTFMRSRSFSEDSTNANEGHDDTQNQAGTNQQSGLRIEEKIARAYHKDMTWRKVLVRLEPDAHNNIIVRRMFANAYGWPVVKHMCDTHFGFTVAAKTRDEDELPIERAKPHDTNIGEEGEEVADQTKPPDERQLQDEKQEHPTTTDQTSSKQERDSDSLHAKPTNTKAGRLDVSSHLRRKLEPSPGSARTQSEVRESKDKVPDLVSMMSAQGEPNEGYSSMHSGTAALNSLARRDSSRWSDRFFESSEDEDDGGDEGDLNVELQKAYDRGIIYKQHGGSPQSTRSGKNSHQSKLRHGTTLTGEVFTAVDEPSTLFDEPEDISQGGSRQASITSSTPNIQGLNLNGLGLGRDVQDINTVSSTVDEGEIGITEQIARART